MLSRLFCFLLCFLLFIQPSLFKNIGNLFNLDDKQLDLLDKLKHGILPKLNEDLMKNDWYFYQYLKENDWNLERAELEMLNHINWREENNMQNIDKEDLSDLETKYPYKVDGVDKHGRPILLIDFDQWDLQDIFISKENKIRFFRYFHKIFDEAAKKVVEQQHSGKNVTKFLLLSDLEKVSASNHANMRASAFYWEATMIMEKHFPGMFNNIITINSPDVWRSVMPLVRTFFSEGTNKGFKDYGDRSEWKPVLDNIIDPKELPPKYGGNKGDAVLVDTFWRNKNGKWVWGKRNL